MVRPDIEKENISIGIVTALQHEYAAVKSLLEDGKPYRVSGRGAGREYWVGNVPSTRGGIHQIALCLADKGNNSASSRATLLTEHFGNVESIIMVGIAGGMPNPTKADDHVRLGDIVVSDQGGVIQYDMVKITRRSNGSKSPIKSWRSWLGQAITSMFGPEQESVFIEPRHPPRAPGARLLEAVRLLSAEYSSPWMPFISRSLDQLGWTRPDASKDVLVSPTDPQKVIKHPHDPSRKANEPRVFFGPIASANVLLKDPIKRDNLRDKFGVKAAEMEASGIADTAWTREIGYLVVRGICDYCDTKKNDVWQPYAAIAAAAYTRALLESMVPDALESKANEDCATPNLELSGTNKGVVLNGVNANIIQVFQNSQITESITGPIESNEALKDLIRDAVSDVLRRENAHESEALQLSETPETDESELKATMSVTASNQIRSEDIVLVDYELQAVQSRAKVELCEMTGRAFLGDIEHLLKLYEYEQAYDKSTSLESWLLENMQYVPNQLLRELYYLLANVELLKSRQLAALSGEPIDISRVEYWIRKAKDVV